MNTSTLAQSPTHSPTERVHGMGPQELQQRTPVRVPWNDYEWSPYAKKNGASLRGLRNTVGSVPIMYSNYLFSIMNFVLDIESHEASSIRPLLRAFK